MTKGDAGQNISKFASSSTESSKITTSLPFISYVDLASWLQLMFEHSANAINAYVSTHSDFGSITDFKSFCDSSTQFSDVFVCECYRDWETDRKSVV